jgi:hypothetical protein
MIEPSLMAELNNWLITIYAVPFASAAVAIMLLLTIFYLILVIREWTTRR